MKELTQNEVGNVKGLGRSSCGLGAFAGAARYLGYAATSGTFSWGQLGVYTAGGANGRHRRASGSSKSLLMPRAAFGVGAVGL